MSWHEMNELPGLTVDPICQSNDTGTEHVTGPMIELTLLPFGATTLLATLPMLHRITCTFGLADFRVNEICIDALVPSGEIVVLIRLGVAVSDGFRYPGSRLVCWQKDWWVPRSPYLLLLWTSRPKERT